MRGTKHRFRRIVGWSALSVLLLLVAAVGTAILVERSDWGHRRLLAYVLPKINASLDGQLLIGSYSGDLLRGLVLHDLEVRDREGAPVVRAHQLALQYSLTRLLHKTLLVHSARIEGLWLRARHFENGELNLATLQRPSSSPPSAHPLQVILRGIVADGEVSYEPPPATAKRMGNTLRTQLHLEGSVQFQGPKTEVQIDHLASTTSEPLTGMLKLAGGVIIDGSEITLHNLSCDVSTDGEEIDKVFPAGQLQGTFAAHFDADGPLTRLKVKSQLHPPVGTIEEDGEFSFATGQAPSWSGNLQVNGVDPGATSRLSPPGRIDLVAEGSGNNGQGTIHLASLEVTSLAAHASAHGTVDLTGHGEGQIEITAHDLSRWARFKLGKLAGELEAKATVKRSESHFVVDASVRGSGLRHDQMQLRKVRLEVHSADFLGDAALDVTGLQLSAQRVEALHLKIQSNKKKVAVHLDGVGPNELITQLELRGKPLLEGGLPRGLDARIERLSMTNASEHWLNQGPAQLRFAVGKETFVALDKLVLASGSEQLTLDGHYAAAARQVTGRLTTRQLDVAKAIGLVRAQPRMPTVVLDTDVTVHGPTEHPVIQSRVHALAQHVEHLDRVDLQATANYEADRLRGKVTLAAAGSSKASTSISGQFDLPASSNGDEPLSFDLSLKDLKLDSLGPWLPAKIAALQGTVEATLKASGTLQAPRVSGRVHAGDWRLGMANQEAKEENNDTELTAELHDGSLGVAGKTRFGGGGGQLDARASLPLHLLAVLRSPAKALEDLERTTPITASVNAQGIDFAKLPFEAAGMHRPVSTGMVDMALTLSGTVRNPLLHTSVQAKNISREDVVDHVDARVVMDLSEHFAHGTADLDLRGATLVHAQGELPLDVGRVLDGQSIQQTPLKLEAHIPSYELKRLRGMQPQLETIEGKVDGDIHLEGVLARPVVQSNVSIDGLRLAETRFARTALAAGVDDSGVKARLDAQQQGGGRMQVDAAVPLTEAAPWKVDLKANRFNLSFVAGTLDGLRSTQGNLEADLQITGSRANPTLEGYARIQDAAFQLRVDPHRYDKIQVQARAHAGALRLEQLSAVSGDGTLRASGDAALKGFMPTRFDLRAETHKFALVFGTLAAWLDSTIVVHGEGDAKHLKARVEVSNGTVRLPKIASTRKLQPIGEPARVRFVDAQAKAEAQKQAAAVAGDEGETGVTVRIPGPFHVRSREANADLEGQLDLVMRGSTLSLTGSAQTTSGWIELLSQRYDIDRARVAFAGEPADPDLDVRITRQLSEALLIVEVHGTGKKPELVLLSDPPIYDKSQLLGILLSGDPGAQRVSERSLDQQVVGAVSGLVLGKVKDAIAPKLPIDVIHVETGNEGYTGLAQTKVEVGKFLTANVYISYVHQFGQAAPNTPASANEARLEYRFLRRYQLDTTVGDVGAASIDLYWTLRY